MSGSLAETLIAAMFFWGMLQHVLAVSCDEHSLPCMETVDVDDYCTSDNVCRCSDSDYFIPSAYGCKQDLAYPEVTTTDGIDDGVYSGEVHYDGTSQTITLRCLTPTYTPTANATFIWVDAGDNSVLKEMTGNDTYTVTVDSADFDTEIKCGIEDFELYSRAMSRDSFHVVAYGDDGSINQSPEIVLWFPSMEPGLEKYVLKCINRPLDSQITYQWNDGTENRDLEIPVLESNRTCTLVQEDREGTQPTIVTDSVTYVIETFNDIRVLRGVGLMAFPTTPIEGQHVMLRCVTFGTEDTASHFRHWWSFNGEPLAQYGDFALQIASYDEEEHGGVYECYTRNKVVNGPWVKSNPVDLHAAASVVRASLIITTAWLLLYRFI